MGMSLSVGDTVSFPNGATGQVWSPSPRGWWVATAHPHPRWVEFDLDGHAYNSDSQIDGLYAEWDR